MSLFSEIIGGQQAQAQEPRNRENQYMAIQQFMADQQAAKRKAMQDQQMFGMQIADRQQAQQLSQQDQANKRLGMQAYLGAVKERAIPGMPGMVGGPNVRPIGVPSRPDLPTLSFDTVAQSIIKNNPKITPEAFSIAMEKFAPQFEAADKMKMAQLNAELRKSVMGPDLAQLAYQNAKAQGLSEEEAIAAGIAAKRAAPKEVGEAERARQEAKVSNAAELEKQKLLGQGEMPENVKRQRAASGFVSSLDELEGLYTQLKDMGGAVEKEKGALENIANRAGASAVGQFVGGALGTEKQAILDKISQMRPLIITDITRATGLTSKQLDSNRELQFYLDAITDPTKEIGANFAAIKRLKERFGNNFEKLVEDTGNQSSDTGQTPAAPATNYSEGMTATNPRTGEKLIYRGGAWVKAE